MGVWRAANLLQSRRGGRRLWQLAIEGGKFATVKEITLLPTEAPPVMVVGKDWRELLRPKLNIAWTPGEKVFLRAVHLPTSDAAEIQSMIELQLEKLSPLPVTHVVWSYHLLPKATNKPEELQTVIVIVALRSFVEEYLGELEGIGYLADRLECPALDEFLATKITQDGVWIFASEEGEPTLIAWRQDNVLQHLTLLPTPPGPLRGEHLKKQLEQIGWAAELEGWLKGTPDVHLVAEPEVALYWEPILREWSEKSVDVRQTPEAGKLAAFGAERASGSDTANLLPKEFATRYRQQFVDSLWMRGVMVAVGVYLFCVLAYFSALYSLRSTLQNAKKELAGLNQNFVESQKDKEEIGILQKRADLQYAALDAWKAVAESMPEGITLEDMYFRSGKLELRGTAPADDLDAIYAFNESLRHATRPGSDQPLFTDVGTPKTTTTKDVTQWNFSSTTREMGAE